MLAVYLGARLVEVPGHGQVRRVAWQARRLTRICLLSLHVDDEKDLQNDDAPEDTPDCQDAFKSVHL